MSIEQATQKIKACGIIAIIRGGFSAEDMLRISAALLAGSVSVVEITLNSPAVLEALPKLRAHFGDELLIGAGTVRNTIGVQQAHDAGAQFLISPNYDSASTALSQSKNLLHLPGVFTATEAQTAFAGGCKMLKLFPIDTAGAAYLKALRAPLDDIDFVPTGGISAENISAYAKAGAVAVGLGSKLVVNREQSAADLTQRAKQLRELWLEGKNG
ncbi:MAG: bifunctional 4-hydroxy-2-oxoglutarate aldolase/2-dehydro-3-deoxy-phosphogluconate aldolase [Anaerolineales bacterium]|nr:bifunctional 4-hydroxy-2-oxoglutarate aldolase/2-dehydro-3-deoxy-phosphogluconate aldolase [Anaerolineales bacterium]